MAVRFFSDEVNFQLKNKRSISKWLQQVVADEGKKTGDLYFIFVADEKILEINKKFLQHNFYTDIITFDDSKGY
ncbi:MAG: rRNA maturation RNAse YbeY, partial [Prevotellaceae bacterium]|nr:rRNA maturation RNAse YbeY [Prevotellaceae bacterium]